MEMYPKEAWLWVLNVQMPEKEESEGNEVTETLRSEFGKTEACSEAEMNPPFSKPHLYRSHNQVCFTINLAWTTPVTSVKPRVLMGLFALAIVWTYANEIPE